LQIFTREQRRLRPRFPRERDKRAFDRRRVACRPADERRDSARVSSCSLQEGLVAVRSVVTGVEA
jgi:hypothetical protein